MSALVVTIPAERRRGAAIALLGAFVLVVLCAIAIPVGLAHRHYDLALDDLVGRLERFERLAAARPALEQKLEAVRAKGSRRFFLKANTASLAAAELQEQVRQAVERSGARLGSIQPAQAREEGGFRQVGVTVQLNANIGSLRRLLLSLDAAEPFLIVDGLTVRSQVPPSFRPPPGFDPEMFVQLEVAGFALKGAAP